MINSILMFFLSLLPISDFDIMRLSNIILNENYTYSVNYADHTFLSQGFVLTKNDYLEYVEIPNNYNEFRIIKINKINLSYENVRLRELFCNEKICKIEILDPMGIMGKNIILDLYTKKNIKPFITKTLNNYKSLRKKHENKERTYYYYVNKINVSKFTKIEFIDELKKYKKFDVNLVEKFQQYVLDVDNYPIDIGNFKFLFNENFNTAYHSVIDNRDYLFFKPKILSSIDTSETPFILNGLILDEKKIYIDNSGKFNLSGVINEDDQIKMMYNSNSQLGNIKSIFNNYKNKINQFGIDDGKSFDGRKKVSLPLVVFLSLLVLFSLIFKFKNNSINFFIFITIFNILIIFDTFYLNFISILLMIIITILNKKLIIKYV